MPYLLCVVMRYKYTIVTKCEILEISAKLASDGII